MLMNPPSSRAPLQATPFDALTQGEKRVAALLAEGLSNKEIASQLDLSEATIKNHVASIYRRTGLRGRGRFIAAASRHPVV